MDLLQESRSLLEAAGFRVVRRKKPDTLYFENMTVYGFVWSAPNADAIVSQWQLHQDEFLRLNVRRIRTLGPKSWNAYSVLLTGTDADEVLLRRLDLLEQDFRGTRKIAQANLFTRIDVVKALYPLLPLQNLVTLDEHNTQERLRTKLNSVLSGDEADVLLSDVPIANLAERLLGR